jgi:geranylgeranyl diphosphate synthase type I
MADATLRNQLAELMSAPELDEADVGRWRTLIAATGAVQRIEEMIADRLCRASEWIDAVRLDDAVRSALISMASVCTQRAA